MKRAIATCGLLLVTACSGASAPSSTATTTPTAAPAAVPSPQVTASQPTAAPQPSASERPACPNAQGGHCLGPLAAGIYSTDTFSPTIRYTVPAGWANYEDLPGNFLLVPPGGSLGGVSTSTGDYIGIYTNVAADAPDCKAAPALGVARSASAIAHALSTRPGLTSTAPEAVTVGGLKGFVLTLKLKKGWTKPECPVPMPNVALLVGVAPSDFESAILATTAIRFYLLDYGGTVMAIEVDDVSGGGRLNKYDAVVKSLLFGSK